MSIIDIKSRKIKLACLVSITSAIVALILDINSIISYAQEYHILLLLTILIQGFYVELLIVPLLVLFSLILRYFHNHYQYSISLLRIKWQDALVILLIIPMIGISCYNGYKLLQGKRIYFNNIHLYFIDNAQSLLKKEYAIKKAISILNRCDKIMYSYTNKHQCAYYRDILLKKERIANQMMKLYNYVNKGNLYAKAKLIHDIAYLNPNKKHLERDFINQLDNVSSLYKKGLRFLQNKKFINSYNIFREVQSLFIGFGDSHILMKESKELSENPYLSKPYTKTLNKTSIEKFYNLVAKSHINEIKDLLRK